MSLQDILKEILSLAETQVATIKEELEKEKAELKKSADSDKAQALEEVREKGKKAAANVEAKMEEMARKENQKVSAQAKRDAINKALAALVKHLSEISDDQYKAFFQNASSDLTDSKGTFQVPSSRLDVAKAVCPSGCEVASDSNVESGFQFVSDQFTVDNTFENLVMSEYRSELEMYFSEKILN